MNKAERIAKPLRGMDNKRLVNTIADLADDTRFGQERALKGYSVNCFMDAGETVIFTVPKKGISGFWALPKEQLTHIRPRLLRRRQTNGRG